MSQELRYAIQDPGQPARDYQLGVLIAVEQGFCTERLLEMQDLRSGMMRLVYSALLRI